MSERDETRYCHTCGGRGFTMWNKKKKTCPHCRPAPPDDKATGEDCAFLIHCPGCGHFLRFASTACPQCDIQFKSADPVIVWKCECERCERMVAAFAPPAEQREEQP